MTEDHPNVPSSSSSGLSKRAQSSIAELQAKVYFQLRELESTLGESQADKAPSREAAALDAVLVSRLSAQARQRDRRETSLAVMLGAAGTLLTLAALILSDSDSLDRLASGLLGGFVGAVASATLTFVVVRRRLFDREPDNAEDADTAAALVVAEWADLERQMSTQLLDMPESGRDIPVGELIGRYVERLRDPVDPDSLRDWLRIRNSIVHRREAVPYSPDELTGVAAEIARAREAVASSAPDLST
jgi:hypothetical protein